MHTTEMIQTNPAPVPVKLDNLSSCIDACYDCAQACISCADACLGEKNLDALRRCIRLDSDCSDICLVTAAVLTRQQQPALELLRRQVETCALICRLCAEECEKHAANHEHCQICGESCRACETACNEVLSIGMAGGVTGLA
jgi:hypothetical protein